MERKGPRTVIRKHEIDALEVVLAHSQMDRVFEDWVDKGEPDYHFWNYLRVLLDLVKEAKLDTPLDYPVITKDGRVAIAASPYDVEPIYRED